MFVAEDAQRSSDQQSKAINTNNTIKRLRSKMLSGYSHSIVADTLSLVDIGAVDKWWSLL